MARHPHLAAIEGVHQAIRVVNRTQRGTMTFKSFRVLLALYNASERGIEFNKNQLMKRLVAMDNVQTSGSAYQLLRLLVLRGYIQQDGQGMGAVIRPSLAGKNYVRGVERYLRNLRWADI
jgi:hypothetical protein